MKRDREFMEVSDIEWALHSDSFEPSRVFNPKPDSRNSLPPIESFAYNSKPIHIIESSSSDEMGAGPIANGNGFEDVDMEVSKGSVPNNRANRIVIEDDEDGSFPLSLSDAEAEEEEVKEDVVHKALRKCEKISAELKRELYGTTADFCDRFSEVDMGTSAVRIVNQDVNEFVEVEILILIRY